MKTLKFLILVIIMCGFSAFINAQTSTWLNQAVEYNIFIPCAGDDGENAVGTIDERFVVHWDPVNPENVPQWHIIWSNGVFIGEETGTVYHVVGTLTHNYEWWAMQPAWHYTNVTLHFYVGTGKDAANYKVRIQSHWTWSAKGQLYNEFDKSSAECF